MILPLLLLGSPLSAGEPAPSEPSATELADVVPLARGQAAPFTGLLVPADVAKNLGARIEHCEFVLASERKEHTALLNVEKVSCEQRRKAAELTYEAQLSLLESSLKAAQEEAKREWYESPTLLIGIGVVGGIAATAGAVYLAGQLRQ